MENSEREYLVSRIIAGKYRIKMGETLLYVSPINNFAKYMGNIIYRETYDECVAANILTSEDALALLKKKGLWTDNNQVQLDKLIKLQEDMKVELYERWNQDNAKLALKLAIKKNSDEIDNLETVKTCFDYMTCESISLSAKFRYMIGTSITMKGGKPMWEDPETDCDKPDEFSDMVMETIARNRIGESQFRELARTEPWISLWSVKEASGNGVFGKASVDLTEDQKNLLIWSGMYDSIRQHHEPPEESVIEDDDALDGWLILQRRKRKADMVKNRLDKISDKVKNSDEVFIMADSQEEAVELTDSLNGKAAKALINQRLQYIDAKSEVPEQLMPNTIRDNQMKMAQIESERKRGL